MTEPKWIFPDAPTVRHPRVYPSRTWRQAQEAHWTADELQAVEQRYTGPRIGDPKPVEFSCPECGDSQALACVVCTPRRHA